MSILQLQATLDAVRVKQPVQKNSAGSNQAARAHYVRNSVNAEVNAAQQPLKLLYQAVITQLNDALQPADEVRSGMRQGDDFNDKSVAVRIMAQARSVYDTFEARHVGEDRQQVLDNFMWTISDGIDKGFVEARDILAGLGVYDGVNENHILRTYDYLQQELAAFQGQKRS